MVVMRKREGLDDMTMTRRSEMRVKERSTKSMGREEVEQQIF